MVGADGRQQHQDRAIRQSDEQNEPFPSGHGPLRGAGADQQAHQEPEIMAGDMEKISFVNVLAAAQPGPPHALGIQSGQAATTSSNTSAPAGRAAAWNAVRAGLAGVTPWPGSHAA